MKIKSLVIASVLAGGLLSSASALTTAAPAKFEAPAPRKTVQPILLPSSHQGSTVNLTMTINKAGKPRNIRVSNVKDQSAYKRIIATISQWEFTPARRNGQPVAARIELPLEVKGL